MLPSNPRAPAFGLNLGVLMFLFFADGVVGEGIIPCEQGQEGSNSECYYSGYTYDYYDYTYASTVPGEYLALGGVIVIALVIVVEIILYFRHRPHG